ncbi:MAG: hypothetical protein U9P12_02990, partial [Verrucomicrobiota bacterium]|nr:hypothetical protein [Verrucomicrobiota bacterium]
HSPDGDESIAGTDPLDETSFFYVSDIRPLADGGCEVVFDTVSGRTYTVYCCSQLGDAWTVLLDGISGDGSPANVVDPYNEGSSFYKVEVGN